MSPIQFLCFFIFCFFLIVARDGGGRRILDTVSPIAIGAAEFDQKSRVIIRNHIWHNVSKLDSVIICCCTLEWNWHSRNPLSS